MRVENAMRPPRPPIEYRPPMRDVVPQPDCKTSEVTDENAELKAMALLRDATGEEAILSLLALDYFRVEGKHGEYRIHLHGGITLHRKEVIGPKTRPTVWWLCVQPLTEEYLPNGDRLLTLYTILTQDEDEFLRKANFRSVFTEDELQCVEHPLEGESIRRW